MNKRKHLRRKSDRFRLAIGIALGLGVAAYVVYTQGCNSKGPTSPDPIVNNIPAPAPAPATGTGTPQTVEAEPTPGGGAGPVSVSCNAAGDCSFSNSGQSKHNVNAVCTRKGEHNDWGSWAGSVPIGTDTLSVSVYDICDPVKIGIDLCEGGEQPVQVDFTAGAGEHIGQWGMNPGLKLVYEPNKEYCECEPSEWKDVEVVGEPFAGEKIECPNVNTDSVQEVCYECFEKWVEVKQSNGCEERTIKRITDGVIREEIECPCVETGPTDVPQQASWNEEIFEGQCEVEVLPLPTEVSFSTDTPKNCHLTGTQTVGIDYSCQEDSSRERVLCRNVECPPPPVQHCYYKIHPWPEAAKPFFCTQVGGVWINFGDSNLINHCDVPYPGIANFFFNLTPGQSAEGCLRKQDAD